MDAEAEALASVEEWPFVYDFTITAVVGLGRHARHARHDKEYRAAVAAVIRQNTPAHVAVDLCFLRPRHMRHFEERYDAWCHALRRGDHHAIAITSARLRRFLARHSQSAASGAVGEGPQSAKIVDASPDMKQE